ncbi:hypothetical protein [Desulfitobacterium sp. PCE1]|uniref:hypothetical protein n=1 Tax=Desulfitobacterium sp. PCE1 TaxID=146907 RepID=UPI000371D6AC|nr:hypothetical protein [Desulfitobacterium sp. PCE1]
MLDYTETRDGDYTIITYSDGTTIKSLNSDIPITLPLMPDPGPSLQEIKENQIALMSAIADIYLKLKEVSL